MITRGSPESASAPASPSSRAPAAPSDSEPPADTAVVVDVTGGEEPWTATSARRTSDPPPLRSSKRASARSAPDMAPTKARKSKKKATKRPTASAAASGAKPLTREAARDSDSDLEVKAAPPPAKKTRKTTAPSAPAPAEVKRPAGPRSDQGFDLTTVMASFQPGRGGAGDGPSRGERDAPTAGPGPDLALELQFLRDEVARLRGIVGAQGPHGDSTRLGITTDPNTRGELPPAELCQLTSASFPEGGKKAKGDYNPPQAHLLAASRMFRSFGTETAVACEGVRASTSLPVLNSTG
ncbi:hypothetical protein PR002_g9940 [Phytophthora rubi]|uniref:Uncharacterized protein n=1 Tax=Phytophthora rubi TaxID=129364 RepID=A0A6A3MD59_9STRA|nr:hypothetical protein PR002_g9940 [Phytophthora rubi]